MSEKSEKTTSRRLSISEAHERAPICAAFVKQMREVFGVEEVIVLMVKEGEIEFDRRGKGS